MATRHFLDISTMSASMVRKLVDDAHTLKQAGRRLPRARRFQGGKDAMLLMIFEKPSTRTRVSFDVAMRQLGGETIVLNRDDLQLGRGETVHDTAKVLSRYADAVMIRANSHSMVLELAEHSTVPIINGLTDMGHPCQIIADVMTMEESLGTIKGHKVAWLGDGNNVLISLIHASVKLGFKLEIACPAKFAPPQRVLTWAKKEGGKVSMTRDAVEAVRGASCVVTDTWVSMGDKDATARKRALKPYRVDQDLMKKAKRNAIFLHCLPAYRGQEVTADVIDGPQSRVFDEAENRVHAQKAILAWCLEGSS